MLNLIVAYLLDRIWGDPLWLPHPVVGFGRLISWGEHRLNHGRHRRLKGALLTATLVTGTYLLTSCLLQGAEHITPWLASAVTTLLLFYGLAGTTLIREVRAVFRAVDRSTEEGAGVW